MSPDRNLSKADSFSASDTDLLSRELGSVS